MAGAVQVLIKMALCTIVLPMNKRTNKTLALILIAMGALVLLGAMVYGYVRLQEPASLVQPDLPALVAGYSLTRALSGEQAILEINRLHGLEFPLVSGAVGVYGTNQQATLWISGSESAAGAQEMMVAMHDRIAQSIMEGNAVFLPEDEQVYGARTVYVLSGMGQRHYYFRSGRLLVWLAIDPGIAGEALEQMLRFYP